MMLSLLVEEWQELQLLQHWPKAGKKVLILEANDYIGGRMKTQKVPLL